MKLVSADITTRAFNGMHEGWAAYRQDCSKTDLVGVFINMCIARYRECGAVFANVWLMPPVATDEAKDAVFAEIGYFRLRDNMVVHNSGAVADLPEDSRDKEWTITDNLNFHKAALKNGLNHVTIKDLFENAKVKLTEPLKLKEVPVASTSESGAIGLSPNNASASAFACSGAAASAPNPRPPPWLGQLFLLRAMALQPSESIRIRAQCSNNPSCARAVATCS